MTQRPASEVLALTISSLGQCGRCRTQFVFRRHHSSLAAVVEAHHTSTRNVPPLFEKSVAAERALNDLVYKPDSHKQLYTAIRRHLQEFTVRNASTAVQSLAHLESRAATANDAPWFPSSTAPAQAVSTFPQATPDVSDVADVESLDIALVARLHKLLAERHQASPTVFAGLAWALAKLGQREPFGSLAVPLYRRTLFEVGLLRGRHVALLLWAALSLDLGGDLTKFVSELLSVATARADANDMVAKDIAMVLWAAARLSESHREFIFEPFLLSLLRAAQRQITEFDAQSTSVSIWALGLMEVENFGLAHQLALHAVGIASRMNSQMLANCAWGAARAGLGPSNAGVFYDTIAEYGTKKLRVAENIQVSNIVWAFSRVDVQSDPARKYFFAVAQHCPNRIFKTSKPAHTAGLAWGLTKLLIVDGVHAEGTEANAARAAVRAAVVRTQATMADFRPRDLSMVMWAVAHAQLHPEATIFFPTAFGHIASATSERPALQICGAAVHQSTGEQNEVLERHTCKFEDFSLAIWSMATLGLCKDDFQSAHVEMMLQAALENLSTGGVKIEAPHLANAAWACSKADFRGSTGLLIERIVDFACDGFECGEWSHKHLVLVAWALVVQGTYTEKCALYVRRIYDAVVQHAHSSHHHDVSTLDLSQLVMIDAALHHDVGLQRVVWRDHDAEHEDAWMKQPMRAPTLIEDRMQSDLQRDVLNVLNVMQLRPELRIECEVEDRGLSIDAVLFPAVPR